MDLHALEKAPPQDDYLFGRGPAWFAFAMTLALMIFDYVDRNVPMLLRMFEKRLRGYRAIGYARDEAPLGYAEPKEDLILEYEEDILRALDHESATDRSDEFAEWVP